MLDLHWVKWSVYFPHGKYICVIWRHGKPTNSGGSYGHKLCSTYSRHIFILLRNRFYFKPREVQTVWFHSQVQRYLSISWRYILTIDNPEFAEHIPDIYPRELQLNQANTFDKETSFLDLNITVIGSNIHTSVNDKRDDFGFPIHTVQRLMLSKGAKRTIFYHITVILQYC